MILSFHSAQLAQLTERRFHAKLIQAIGERDESARAELSSPEGSAILRRQCAQARHYGLAKEIDIARYVITAWLLGTDFDTRFPAMAQVLSSERLTPAKKADAIEKIALAVLQELSPQKALI